MLCMVFLFVVNVFAMRKVTVFPLEHSFLLGAWYPAVLSPGQEPECSLPAVGLDVLKVSALICVGGHR